MWRLTVLTLALLNVVEDAGVRQRPLLTYEPLTLLPVAVALVAARAEPGVPRTLEMLANHFAPLAVATDTRGVVVASPLCT